MAIKIVRLEQCDAPFCEVEYPDKPGVLNFGYHIHEMKYVEKDGNISLVDVYACSIDHVAPAISAKIDEVMVKRVKRKKK